MLETKRRVAGNMKGSRASKKRQDDHSCLLRGYFIGSIKYESDVYNIK